jgi:hypothetical protein
MSIRKRLIQLLYRPTFVRFASFAVALGIVWGGIQHHGVVWGG